MRDSSTCQTLVVTSAVHPPGGMPFLKITDSRDRLFQSYCALIRWIRETPIQKIVLCDATVATCTFDGLDGFAQRYGKRIEVLTFEADLKRAVRCGKGFGEGQIMRHVILHSRLLASEGSFYKVSGRLFVENFDELHEAHADDDLVFGYPGTIDPRTKLALRFAVRIPLFLRRLEPRWRGWGKGMVETSFYKCTRKFYADTLIDRYERVDDRECYFLEHSFFVPLIRAGCPQFVALPRFVGYNATLGKLYGDRDYSREVKEEARQMLDDISRRRSDGLSSGQRDGHSDPRYPFD